MLWACVGRAKLQVESSMDTGQDRQIDRQIDRQSGCEPLGRFGTYLHLDPVSIPSGISSPEPRQSSHSLCTHCPLHPMSMLHGKRLQHCTISSLPKVMVRLVAQEKLQC